MGNSASQSNGAEPSAPANSNCSKLTSGCTKAQNPANPQDKMSEPPKADLVVKLGCPPNGECEGRECCIKGQNPSVPASKPTPVTLPPPPPPSDLVGQQPAAPTPAPAPQQVTHQQPPVQAHQQGYQQAYYVPQSGQQDSPAFYITSKDPQSQQPPQKPTQKVPQQLPHQSPLQPQQPRTITLPPPMMLSGATPVRGPAPIPPQHQHLYTNSTSPPVAQAPPKRQPGCGSMQNVCSPSLCPPSQAKKQTVTGTSQQAVPYGSGPFPHVMSPPAGGYTNHQESRPDTIPPNADSPPHTGKIFSTQIYPPILKNYQSVPSAAGASAGHGNGSVPITTPAVGSVIHAIPQHSVSRPGLGDAL